jgi:hypothetical protein
VAEGRVRGRASSHRHRRVALFAAEYQGHKRATGTAQCEVRGQPAHDGGPAAYDASSTATP